MKTGLNNVLLPTLFIAVNNIEYCYTQFRLNNIVQYCWQVWTTWAAKHCSVLLSNGLGVFCRVVYSTPRKNICVFVNLDWNQILRTCCQNVQVVNDSIWTRKGVVSMCVLRYKIGLSPEDRQEYENSLKIPNDTLLEADLINFVNVLKK
jgi:hypothetical protein